MPEQDRKMEASSPTCELSNPCNPVNKLVINNTKSNNDNWKKWWQSFNLYILASNLENVVEKRKVAIMLNQMGEKGIEIFNSFNLSIENTTLTQVKEKFDKHFEPQKNVTMSRHFFFTRKQLPGETIESFVANLETLSFACEFKELRDSLVRDMFIANLNQNMSHIRQRLLQESSLTLQKALEIAKTIVIAQENTLKIESSDKSRRKIELSEILHCRRYLW
jgi:hypothetical protein